MTLSIQRIVFATDFSRSAQIALDWATRFATQLKADLHVVHAWQVPVLVGPAGAYLASAELMGPLERELAAELEKVCEARPVAGRHLIRSTPEEAVKQVVAQVKADVVVVGTQGGSTLEHVVFGSVAERILRTSSVPVVLVPKSFGPLLERGELVRRVLTPVDMGPDSDAVIAEGAALAAQFSAPMDVIHVTELPPYVQRHASIAADVEAALVAELKEIVRRVGAKNVTADLKLGRPGPALVAYIDESEVDFVVMRTHGHGTVERFFLGSVTERVIRTGGVPVLVLPALASA